jgi:hypothetical protein
VRHDGVVAMIVDRAATARMLRAARRRGGSRFGRAPDGKCGVIAEHEE